MLSHLFFKYMPMWTMEPLGYTCGFILYHFNLIMAFIAAILVGIFFSKVEKKKGA